MIEWPDTLPSPLIAEFSLTPKENVLRRQLQSGRSPETRRFGAGTGDMCPGKLTLSSSGFETFKYFYEHTLNMGIEWFFADWIEKIGLTSEDYIVKIVGYPAYNTSDNITIYVSITLYICKIRSTSDESVTKMTNPSALSGPGLKVAFDRSGEYFAIACTSSPYFNWFSRNGTGFAKLSNPSSPGHQVFLCPHNC